MPNLYEMKPDQVVGWIRGKIRARLGDQIENLSDVYAKHGYYYIKVPQCEQLILRRSQLDKFWKKLEIKKGE